VPGGEWLFATSRGARRVPVRPVLASNQIDVALDACLQGVGIGQFLGYQVQALLDAKRLTRVLGEFEPDATAIHLIYPHARLLSTNVRAFVDWTVPRMRKRLAPR